MTKATLESIITRYVPLQAPNSKGWQAVRCHVCNDHTKKGLRGNFLFDGDTVVYKCWNCRHLAKYNPYENEAMPKNMLTVLDVFGIPADEWRQVVLDSPAFVGGGIQVKSHLADAMDIEPKEITMPSHFYYLKDAAADDEIAQEANEYIIKERGIDPTQYPFMLSTKPDNPRLQKWLGRVILPIYKNNKLIYYTGRALYDAVKKYETPPSVAKEKVLYGFELLFEHTSTPLLVVEGIFDAIVIDGVATLGNIITKAQIEWLNRSKREKIYIPDKFGDGRHAAEQALANGWSISTPDIGSSCKDMNDAVNNYGKLYVIQSIMENRTSDEFEALTNLRTYCVT